MTPWPRGGVTLAQLRRAGARALLGPTFLAARAIGDAMERSPEEAVRRYQWDLVQEILHQAYDASPW